MIDRTELMTVPGTRMVKRYDRESDEWVYSLTFTGTKCVTNEMQITARLDLEKEIYQSMLHQMIGLCNQELENTR